MAGKLFRPAGAWPGWVDRWRGTTKGQDQHEGIPSGGWLYRVTTASQPSVHRLLLGHVENVLSDCESCRSVCSSWHSHFRHATSSCLRLPLDCWHRKWWNLSEGRERELRGEIQWNGESKGILRGICRRCSMTSQALWICNRMEITSFSGHVGFLEV